MFGQQRCKRFLDSRARLLDNGILSSTPRSFNKMGDTTFSFPEKRSELNVTTAWKCFTSTTTDGARTASISFKDFARSLMVSIGLNMANVLIKKQVTPRTNSPLYPTGSSTSISMEIGKLQDTSALTWTMSKNAFIKPCPSQSSILETLTYVLWKTVQAHRGLMKPVPSYWSEL